MSVPNEAEVREALRKMIGVLRKYNIRYVLSTPEYETYWWLSITVNIDDLYRTLCDYANRQRPVRCKRVNDGFLVGVIEQTDLQAIRDALVKFMDQIPYRLHPDFAVSRLGDGFLIAMKLYDDDIINALFGEIRHTEIEQAKLQGDLWVRVRFLSR
jgi:hypothetical protein